MNDPIFTDPDAERFLEQFPRFQAIWENCSTRTSCCFKDLDATIKKIARIISQKTQSGHLPDLESTPYQSKWILSPPELEHGLWPNKNYSVKESYINKVLRRPAAIYGADIYVSRIISYDKILIGTQDKFPLDDSSINWDYFARIVVT